MEEGEVQPCFLMTSKSAPVTLWDPTEGCARATYRAYNAMDEHISPYSLLWPTTAAAQPGLSSSTFYAGYGSMEDTVAHVRAYDASVEGRTPTWWYKSRFATDRTTIVSHLTEVMHATNPNLLGIGYTGGSTGHLVEILDTRHRKTATLLQPVDELNKPLTPTYNGTACIRVSKQSPWRLYTAPRVSQNGRTAQPVFVWDIRRSSAPVRTVIVDNAPEICGAFFDVAASEGREVIITATKRGGLACYEATNSASSTEESPALCAGAPLAGASTVTVVHAGDDSLRNVVVAVGGGGRPISEAPLRDRWEENEGLGTSRSGLRRGRDGTQLLPFDDTDDVVAVSAETSRGPWLSLAVVSLPV
jgi:hypothetical protein